MEIGLQNGSQQRHGFRDKYLSDKRRGKELTVG